MPRVKAMQLPDLTAYQADLERIAEELAVYCGLQVRDEDLSGTSLIGTSSRPAQPSA